MLVLRGPPVWIKGMNWDVGVPASAATTAPGPLAGRRRARRMLQVASG